MKISLFTGVVLFLSTLSVFAFECRVIEPEIDNRRYARNQIDVRKGVPRTVQLVYFAPSDTNHRPEVVEDIKREIQQVRVFYAQQMEKHGYNWTTFRIETNAHGIPKIREIKGQHPESYYRDNGIYRAVRHELESKFDMDSNIYLVIVELVKWNKIDGADGRGGRFGKTGGMVLVPDEYWLKIAQGEDDGIANQKKTWRNVMAHELGHAFGLDHDFRNDTYLMSYGIPSQISMCAADFLTVHPYFDETIPVNQDTLPSISLMSSPKYAKGSETVTIEIEAVDVDGIHQLSLLVQTTESHYTYQFFELKSCYTISGNSVEVIFDYDGIVPSDMTTRLSDSTVHFIAIRAVDTKGDITDSFFNLVEKSVYHIAELNNGTDAQKIAISSDSKYFAISVDGVHLAKVNLWDIDSLQIIGSPKLKRPPDREYLGNEIRSSVVDFSLDGTLVTSALYPTMAKSGAIQLWNVPSLQLIKNFGSHPDSSVRSIDFSPNGKRVVVGTTLTLARVWDIVNEKNITIFSEHVKNEYNYGTVNAVTCSPDGKIIASGASSDRIVRLWDGDTGRNMMELDVQSNVYSLKFSPNGRILASGTFDFNRRKAFRLWDIPTGNNIFTSNARLVTGISFYPDGSAVAFSDDNEIRILDLKTKEIVQVFGNTGSVRDISFSPDGSVLIATIRQEMAPKREINLWDMSWWGNQVELREIFKIEDITTDGVVDIQDLLLVVSRLGNKSDDLADINKDGVVDILDLVLVANAMEKRNMPDLQRIE